jgi:RNA polymerase sigma factor (sigma-70 family)
MSDTHRWPTPEQLTLLGQIVRDVARLGRLTPQDQDDFFQSVQLKMLERNYDTFHRFRGQSSLRSYLTVVVKRLLLDWRNATQGKWRPSAAAVRIGPTAIALERLIHRDGHRTSEAIELLKSQGCPDSPGLLMAVVERLPARPRRRVIFDDDLMDSVAVGFEDPIAATDRRQRESRVRRALRSALRQLSPEDFSLIRLRYREGYTIRRAAERLRVKPAVLYRRMERSLRSLRRSLAAAGVEDASVH